MALKHKLLFSLIAQASQFSVGQWKMLCIPWEVGCLPPHPLRLGCLRLRAAPPCGNVVGNGVSAVKSQCYPCNQRLLALLHCWQCCTRYTCCAWQWWVGAGWTGRGQLVHLWLCSPPSNDIFLISAVSPLYLYPSHWDYPQHVSATHWEMFLSLQFSGL